MHLAQFGSEFFSLCPLHVANVVPDVGPRMSVAISEMVDLLSVFAVGCDGFCQLSQSSSVLQLNAGEGSSVACLPVGSNLLLYHAISTS